MSRFPTPFMVRLEYWNRETGEWGPGHEELGLIDPAAYVQRLTKRGYIARTIDRETGETHYPEGGELL